VKSSFINDSLLYFGNNIKAMDPRIGLLKGGPIGPYKNATVEHRQINYGIIGTAEGIEKCKLLIREISNPLPEVETATYGNLGFPGLGKKSPLLFSLITDVSWLQKIFTKELSTISSITDYKIRINSLVELYDKKLKMLKEIETVPDIVFKYTQIWRKY